jgi:hypothetical protein
MPHRLTIPTYKIHQPISPGHRQNAHASAPPPLLPDSQPHGLSAWVEQIGKRLALIAFTILVCGLLTSLSLSVPVSRPSFAFSDPKIPHTFS